MEFKNQEFIIYRIYRNQQIPFQKQNKMNRQKQSGSSGSNTAQNFYARGDDISSTISHNGNIIGTAQKRTQNSSFLKSQNVDSMMSKIKLKCVSKISKPCAQSYDLQQHLFIFTNNYDSQHFQQYINSLKKQIVQKQNCHFIRSVDQYKQVHKYKTQKQKYLVLMSQYSAINYRKEFKYAEEIIIIADEEYASCSYLMKQHNISYLLYEFDTINKILRQKKIIKPQKCQQNKTKQVSAKINQNNYETKVIESQNQDKQNRETFSIRNTEFLPMNSVNNGQKQKIKMLARTHIQMNSPFFQQDNNQNITFKKLDSINNNNTEKIDDHIIIIQDNYELNQYDLQLRKVTFQAIKQRQKCSEQQRNTKYKSKISIPWYKKYVKSITKKCQTQSQGGQSQNQSVGIQCQIIKQNMKEKIKIKKSKV